MPFVSRFFVVFCVIIFCISTVLNSQTKLAPSGTELLGTVLSTEYKTVSYKTTIAVFGNRISGIVIIKQSPDSVFRFVMVNEFGLSLLQFEFANDSIKLIECQEFLNKPALITLLGEDFKTLLLPRKGYTNYREKKANSRIRSCFNANDNKFKISSDSSSLRPEQMLIKKKGLQRVNYQFIYDAERLPLNISIRHKRMPIKINLNRLKIVE